MEKKHMERYSASEQSLNIIGEMKIKTERSFHYTSIRTVKIKNIYILTVPNDEDEEDWNS